eukprot:CAMPEP_0116565438 /NCGR_PEP_ID=MMETSP0397-20121206/13899_1 /TAXON_ID=216820 /ORGANISM="Cyclophora tenuis, Strain ECT3854" /LENGTH=679 /DNA_ID=CAMNT_0004092213 /DNA_START=44 /DNA_END=2083 /DNA_ORIENTATION=-
MSTTLPLPTATATATKTATKAISPSTTKLPEVGSERRGDEEEEKENEAAMEGQIPTHDLPKQRRRSTTFFMRLRRRRNNKNNDIEENDKIALEQTTRLWELVSDREWDKASRRASRCPGETFVWNTPTTATTTSSSSVLLMLPLHHALLNKAPLDVIRSLVVQNPNALVRCDSFGMTPLHVACQAGLSLEIVELLVSSSSTTTTTTTPTTRSNTVEEDEESVPVQRSAEWLDSCGRTPLHLACASHALRMNVIQYLLQQAPDAATCVDAKGFLPADYVGPHPHQKRILRDLDRGIDYWQATPTTTTSPTTRITNRLVHYIQQRQWNELRLLLQGRLDQEDMIQAAQRWIVVRNQRYLPVHLACQEQAPVDIVTMLLQLKDATMISCQECNMLPLHLACQYGAPSRTVEALIRANPKATLVVDDHGLLPLHLACTEGASLDTLTLLLNSGKNNGDGPAMKRRDLRGFTPLDYARNSRHPHRNAMCDLLQKSPSPTTQRPTQKQQGSIPPQVHEKEEEDSSSVQQQEKQTQQQQPALDGKRRSVVDEGVAPCTQPLRSSILSQSPLSRRESFGLQARKNSQSSREEDIQNDDDDNDDSKNNKKEVNVVAMMAPIVLSPKDILPNEEEEEEEEGTFVVEDESKDKKSKKSKKKKKRRKSTKKKEKRRRSSLPLEEQEPQLDV